MERYGAFVMVGKWPPKVHDTGVAPKVGLFGVGGTKVGLNGMCLGHWGHALEEVVGP